MSVRHRQRTHRQIVGLTRKQINQIQQAEYATKLLQKGLSSTAAAAEAGYADQAHMIRSLKKLRGKTPSQIQPFD